MNKSIAAQGFSFLEMLASLAIFSIIILAVGPLLRQSMRGYNTFEIATALNNSGQKVLQEIRLDLSNCKKIFGRNTLDLSYVSNIQQQLGGELPPAIVNTTSPEKWIGSISPNTDSWVKPLDRTVVGNCLLLTTFDEPQEILVVNDDGNVDTVRVDTYRFVYYYLGHVSGRKIVDEARRNLYVFRSEIYADYSQVYDSSEYGTTVTTQVNTYLLGKSIRYAWNPYLSANAAFFTYAPDGLGYNQIVSDGGHNIKRRSGKAAIEIQAGSGGGGSFIYGVAPNSNTDPKVHYKHPVPLLAIAGGTVNQDFKFGSYPSGFEIVIAGVKMYRQIFVRLVLVADGAIPGPMMREHILLTTVNDMI